MYDLLTKCIEPDEIFNLMCEEMLEWGRTKTKISSELCGEIAKVFTDFDHRNKQGGKPIIHLEALSARLMVIVFNANKL